MSYDERLKDQLFVASVWKQNDINNKKIEYEKQQLQMADDYLCYEDNGEISCCEERS